MPQQLNDRFEVKKYFTPTPPKPIYPPHPSFPVDEEAEKQKMIGFAWFGVTLVLVFTLALIILAPLTAYWGWKSYRQGAKKIDQLSQKHAEASRRHQAEVDEIRKEYERKLALAEPKPSDNVIDMWIKEDLTKILKEAQERLGFEDIEDIDDEDKNKIDPDLDKDPLVIGGPAKITDTKYVVGKDGKVRFSHLNVSIIFLTAYHIASYECISSLEDGQIWRDSTKEFPYAEITNLGITTVREIVDFINEKSATDRRFREFVIETTGGNSMHVSYSFVASSEKEGELVEIGEGENTIKAVRKRLKDYKEKHDKY